MLPSFTADPARPGPAGRIWTGPVGRKADTAGHAGQLTQPHLGVKGRSSAVIVIKLSVSMVLSLCLLRSSSGPSVSEDPVILTRVGIVRRHQGWLAGFPVPCSGFESVAPAGHCRWEARWRCANLGFVVLSGRRLGWHGSQTGTGHAGHVPPAQWKWDLKISVSDKYGIRKLIGVYFRLSRCRTASIWDSVFCPVYRIRRSTWKGNGFCSESSPSVTSGGGHLGKNLYCTEYKHLWTECLSGLCLQNPESKYTDVHSTEYNTGALRVAPWMGFLSAS